MIKNNFLVITSTLFVLTIFVFSCNQIDSTTPTQSEKTLIPTVFSTATQIPVSTSLPTTTSIPTSTPDTHFYTVVAGDTLWGISINTGIPVAYIALANDIVDPGVIYPDQVLYIPDSSDSPPNIKEMDKKIVVILSMQKLYAYENGKPIEEFLVSTGLPETPTVQGLFSIRDKYPSTTMSGPGYYLENVLWTMYFYEDYGIHATYWHNNFGHPMSHGCVNMRESDAQWLYNWAPLGTIVLILP